MLKNKDDKIIQCITCKVEKPSSEFHRLKSNNSGFHSSCKICVHKRNKEHKLRYRYDVKTSKYNEVLKEQNNQCVICGCPLLGTWNSSVDHDHETGLFRGILCRACNGGLGMFKDDVELVFKAYLYLNFWNEVQEK